MSQSVCPSIRHLVRVSLLIRLSIRVLVRLSVNEPIHAVVHRPVVRLTHHRPRVDLFKRVISTERKL